MRELAADLKHLEDQDDEESKKEEQSSRWGYPVSLIYGKVNETEEQKQVQATERLNRLQSHRIKKARVGENEAKIQRQRDALQQVSDEIVDKKDYVEGEKKKGEDEKRKREDKAKKPSRMKEEEKYQRMARDQKEGAAQERARMTTAAERHQNNWVNPASMYPCPHENFWVPIRGFHTCQVCQDAPSAFQCPGCKMVECSGCFRGVNKRL